MKNAEKDADLYWDEDDTDVFLQNADVFIPYRDVQADIITRLVGEYKPEQVLELCPGEGYLTKKILEKYPSCLITAFDGSEKMIRKARENLQEYHTRFSAGLFRLEDKNWRKMDTLFDAIISSLAIHHLDGPGKKELFKDIYSLLKPGGLFVIADLILPCTSAGKKTAAYLWDKRAGEQSVHSNGNREAFRLFQELEWNLYTFPDPADKPSGIQEQLQWFLETGYCNPDVFWLYGGHAIYGAEKPLPLKKKSR